MLLLTYTFYNHIFIKKTLFKPFKLSDFSTEIDVVLLVKLHSFEVCFVVVVFTCQSTCVFTDETGCDCLV